MPRHQLTPAERQRGHKLTREDRAKGGRNVPKEIRSRAGHATAARLVEAGRPYRFNSETAKLASLKRWALHRIYLAGPEKTYAEVAAMGARRAAAPSPEPAKRQEDDAYVAAEWEATKRDLATGAALASKLLAGEGLVEGNDPTPSSFVLTTVGPPGEPSPDPFTLSALKRFRLGPLSPLSLTRSQRAQVDLMRDAGYLEATATSMLALTEKGRQAIESNNETGNE